MRTSKVQPLSGTTVSNSDSKEVQTAYFDEWCQVTAWHCMIHVHKANKSFKKIAWLGIVLSAGFLAFYQSSVLLSGYIGDKRWVTSVSYEMTSDGALNWPNISVCNLNEFFKSRFEADNLTDPRDVAFVATMLTEGIEFYDKYQRARLSKNADVNETVSSMRTLDRFEGGLRRMINMSATEMMFRYRKRCNETVLHCGRSMQFSLHESPYNCCDSQQTLHWPGCFVLRPTLTFGRSLRNSLESGIYFLLNPQVKDYYHNVILDKKPSAGLRVHIYYGTFESSVPATVLVSPGTHTLVSLVQERHRTITERYSSLPFVPITRNCTDSRQYYHADSTQYSEQLCLADCWNAWEIRAANCTIGSAPSKANRECVGEQIPNFIRVSRDPQKWNTTFPDGFNVYTCMAECGEACECTDVDAKISQATFPAPPQVTAFTTYLNGAFPSDHPYKDDETKDLILFEMFYRTLAYRMVTKMEKTTIGTFISNIGGALGVWTGLSMLSLLQALVYLGEFLIVWIRRVVVAAARKQP